MLAYIMQHGLDDADNVNPGAATQGDDMKPRAATLVAFVMMIAIDPALAEQAREMFGVRWGMTRTQVRHRYPLLSDCSGRLCSANTRVGGMPTDIVFEFYKDRLVSMVLAPDMAASTKEELNTADKERYRNLIRVAWSSTIKEFLHRRYGEPRAGRLFGLFLWSGPDTEILFYEATEDHPEIVSLSYEQRSTQQTRKEAAAAEQELDNQAESRRF